MPPGVRYLNGSYRKNIASINKITLGLTGLKFAIEQNRSAI